ncbi:MAG: L-threonylcarbamoyladenylate synthase [Vampirovibrionales bacterium]|nr:L-threonylcarbamoyladenylate synthase [Vampirovibrionales bacterium]
MPSHEHSANSLTASPITRVIAFATDTVYGLGADVTDNAAIEGIYALKGRDENKPLILLGHAWSVFLPYLAALTPAQVQQVNALTEHYWPGPLTLVLPASTTLNPAITRGLPTVGVRIPDCESLIAYLKTLPSGVLATTSANRSGEPACKTAAQVTKVFGTNLMRIIVDDAAVNPELPPSAVVGVMPNGELTVYRSNPSVKLDA